MKKTNSNPYASIIAIAFGLILLYLKFKNEYILYGIIFLFFIALVSKKTTKKVDVIWMKLAWLLSLIIPKIVLTILFYLVLFPLAFISKLFGVNNGVDLKNNKDSFFKNTYKTINKNTFENPW